MALFSTNPNQIITPPVMIILCTSVLIFNMADIGFEIWFPREAKSVEA
jgi:hypothetical protein